MNEVKNPLQGNPPAVMWTTSPPPDTTSAASDRSDTTLKYSKIMTPPQSGPEDSRLRNDIDNGMNALAVSEISDEENGLPQQYSEIVCGADSSGDPVGSDGYYMSGNSSSGDSGRSTGSIDSDPYMDGYRIEGGADP